MWLKYNLICTHCDTLFEVTTLDFKKAPTCVCEYPDELILLGWEDATVSQLKSLKKTIMLLKTPVTLRLKNMRL